MNKKGIGALVRLAREEKGWTQQQLAAALGCSQQNVSDIERGNVSIRSEDLEVWASLLDKEVSYFFEERRREEFQRVHKPLNLKEIESLTVQRMKEARQRQLLAWRCDARERWWKATERVFEVGSRLLLAAASEFEWPLLCEFEDERQGVRQIGFLMPGSSSEGDGYTAWLRVEAWPEFDDWTDESPDPESGERLAQSWKPWVIVYFGPGDDNVLMELDDDLLVDEHKLRETLASAMVDAYCAYVSSGCFPAEAELSCAGLGEDDETGRRVQCLADRAD
jgi:transcriptional regulator with XRE-family HTH domain